MADYKLQSSEEDGQYTGSSLAERRVTWRDYMRVFYKGRFAILVTFVVVFFSAVILTFTKEPVYEAGVRLMLEGQDGVSQSIFDFTSMMQQETMINNQVEILKSRTLAERVIRNLKTSAYAHRLEILERADTVRHGFSLAKLVAFGGQEEWSEEDVFDENVKDLREATSVRHIRNTDMMEIKFKANNPFEAYYVANAIAEVYENINKEESQAEVRQLKEFLEEQSELYERELKASEEELKAYQESANVVALDRETSELVSKIAEFETLYNAARTDLEAARQRLEYIDSELAAQNANFDIETISKNTALEEFTKKIAQQEARLAMYQSEAIQKGQTRYTRKEIETLQGRINALKNQFKEDVKSIAANQFVDPAQISGSLFSSKIEVETEIRALEPKVEIYGRIVQDYNAELETLPAKKLQLARLTRQSQVAEKLYVMLQEKYQESRITEVGQLGNVRIIDAAKAPKEPIAPKKKLNLVLGLLLGLGLGVAIAFAMDYMDDSISTMEDLEPLGSTLIATIPNIKPEHENGIMSKLARMQDPEAFAINERLVTHLKPRSPVSEAYRSLRTNILFTAPENPKHVILMTSSGPREGKSTSVANLAITFAQMGTSTLLIDADLRRPMLDKLFQVDQQPGLTNVLVGQKDISEIITRVEQVPNLHLLTCGINPPNPAELLGSERMRELLNQLREKFSVILIDAPPVIAVTDPSVLARFVDGVVLVVRAAQTQRSAAVMAAEQLKRVEAPLLGLLLNGVSSTNFYGAHYHHEYYYYYTDDGDRKRKKNKARSMGDKI